MIYMVLDVQSTQHTDKCSLLNAWVNVHTKNEAMSIISDELLMQGWAVTNLIEATPTTEDDYFPPCTSLDAFNEAEKSLLALRFS